MRNLEFKPMGEYGITGRRYFRRPATDGHPAFHVHVFQVGAEQVAGHLAFRDFLLAHPDKAREYSDLKKKLAAAGSGSKSAYQKAKAPFVEACIRMAMDGPCDLQGVEECEQS